MKTPLTKEQEQAIDFAAWMLEKIAESNEGKMTDTARHALMAGHYALASLIRDRDANKENAIEQCNNSFEVIE